MTRTKGTKRLRQGHFRQDRACRGAQGHVKMGTAEPRLERFSLVSSEGVARGMPTCGIDVNTAWNGRLLNLPNDNTSTPSMS